MPVLAHATCCREQADTVLRAMRDGARYVMKRRALLLRRVDAITLPVIIEQRRYDMMRRVKARVDTAR